VRTASDPALLEKPEDALRFFNTLEKAYVLFGLFGAFGQIIMMLKNLKDPSRLGFYLAMAIINIAAAALVILLFVIPLRHGLSRESTGRTQTETGGEKSAVPLGRTQAELVGENAAPLDPRRKMLKPWLMSALVVLVFILVFRIFLGTALFLFVDIWSLMAIPLLGTLYALAVNGFSRSIDAVRTPFAKAASSRELSDAGRFFRLLDKSYTYVTLVCFAVSFADMFFKWDERTALGPRLAFALVNIIYLFLLQVLLILPVRGIIERRLAEEE
jgi:flagellar motor component MotA